MIDDLVGDLIGEAVTSAFIGARWKKRAEGARRDGGVLAAVRIREGSLGGVRRGWRVLELRFSPGAIRIGSAPLRVEEIEPERTPLGYWDRVRLQAPAFVVLILGGDGWKVECAIPPEDVERVIRSIGSPPASR